MSALADMRGELVRLNTDLEGKAIGLEEIYRDALEGSVINATACNFYETVHTYEFAVGIGEFIRKKVAGETAIIGRLAKAEDLALRAIVEKIIEKCGCKLQPLEEEEQW